MNRYEQAMLLLAQFEKGTSITPPGAERLVVDIFEACGLAVTEKGFIGNDDGVDCFVRTEIEGKRQIIGVEVKHTRLPVGVASINQAFHMRSKGPFDRAMVISRSGFTLEALQEANAVGLGLVDLLGPSDLRNWLHKHSPSAPPDKTAETIIRQAMKELARLIAEHPEELWKTEWRDLERVMRETFEGLGFDTKLTRSGKDGGFDLELAIRTSGTKQTYLVEVKHWMDQKPGPAHLKKLMRVTASKGATGSLLLSTSGFTSTIYSGIAELSAPVRLAGGDKVVSLCKAYYRLGSALWTEATDLREILYSGTRAIGEHGSS